MLRKLRWASAVLLGLALMALGARGAEPSASLKKGTPDLKSAGPLAFGPDGILFVGDTTGAALFAIDTGDRTPAGDRGAIKVEDIDQKVAALLGTTSQQIQIRDLAVNPASGNVYLAVARGRGPDATPVLLRVGRDGKLAEVALENVPFAKADVPNPPSASASASAPPAKGKGQRPSPRSQSITDLAYADGRVFLAGLSNEEFSSRFLAIPFPFTDSVDGASVEIYHGSHGQFETKSPIRTFVAYQIQGEPYLLASYTCTPLVKVPVAELKAGAHVKGTTIAELGNRNNPLDMIAYHKDGKDYLLMANDSRGVMKIPTEGAGTAASITRRVSDKQGLGYETIDTLKGVTQMDQLDKSHAVVLIQRGGNLNLETVELP
jgi:hypothetical protein